MKHTLACLLFLTGLAYGADRCIDEALCSVTIIHLISNPERYDKKEVIVRGYFVYDEKQSNLYLDSEKAKHGLSEYSLSLDLTEIETQLLQQKTGEYVLIQGAFNQHDRGFGVPTAGTVVVTRLGSP